MKNIIVSLGVLAWLLGLLAVAHASPVTPLNVMLNNNSPIQVCLAAQAYMPYQPSSPPLWTIPLTNADTQLTGISQPAEAGMNVDVYSSNSSDWGCSTTPQDNHPIYTCSKFTGR